VSTDKQGFIRFPHDLFDAILRTRLSISQQSALLYIIRKTVGFNKTSDKISISRMARVLGHDRKTMIRAVHHLESLNIIQIGEVRTGRVSEIRLLDPDLWAKPVARAPHVAEQPHVAETPHPPVARAPHPPVASTPQEPVARAPHTKETIYRNTYKEKGKKDEISSSDDVDDGWFDPAELRRMMREENELL